MKRNKVFQTQILYYHVSYLIGYFIKNRKLLTTFFVSLTYVLHLHGMRILHQLLLLLTLEVVWQAAKGILKLSFALIVLLPALLNIGTLLTLITLIYAIIDIALFGQATNYGAINEMVRYKTLGRNMLLLFRLMTGARCNDILDPLLIQPPYCYIAYQRTSVPTIYCTAIAKVPSWPPFTWSPSSCCHQWSSSTCTSLSCWRILIRHITRGLEEEDLNRFYAKWLRFDPFATQFIAFSVLSDIVTSLDPPLGISRPNLAARVNCQLTFY